MLMTVSEVWRLTEEEGDGRMLLDVVCGLLMAVVAAEVIRVASSCIMLVPVAYGSGKLMRVVLDIPAAFASPTRSPKLTTVVGSRCVWYRGRWCRCAYGCCQVRN